MSSVTLTGVEFDRLPEYSASLPTGVFVGKRWKKQMYKAGKPTGRWRLGTYTRELPAPTCCRYHRCIVGVVDDKPCTRIRTAAGQHFDPSNPDAWHELPNRQVEIQWLDIICPERGIGVAPPKPFSKPFPVHLL